MGSEELVSWAGDMTSENGDRGKTNLNFPDSSSGFSLVIM